MAPAGSSVYPCEGAGLLGTLDTWASGRAAPLNAMPTPTAVIAIENAIAALSMLVMLPPGPGPS